MPKAQKAPKQKHTLADLRGVNGLTEPVEAVAVARKPELARIEEEAPVEAADSAPAVTPEPVVEPEPTPAPKAEKPAVKTPKKASAPKKPAAAKPVKAAPVAQAGPGRREAFPDAGFAGTVEEDGFPTPSSRADGGVSATEPEGANRNFDVHVDSVRGLYSIRLDQKKRGRDVSIESVLDAALLLVPADLHDVVAFIYETPSEVLKPREHSKISGRVRLSKLDQIGDLPDLAQIEGVGTVTMSSVYRAAIWHYVSWYESRSA